jgi:hypothetical protein
MELVTKEEKVVEEKYTIGRPYMATLHFMAPILVYPAPRMAHLPILNARR